MGSIHHRKGSSPEQVEKACAKLRARFPTQVSADGGVGYWDLKQSSVKPALRIEPSNAQEVSEILKILVEENCHFAIKSGGYARGEGSSNADGGVTIDLVRFDGVEIAGDKKSVRVGSGGRWLDVYSKLDPYGLTVPGGRVAKVGVGGFLLGGGISFFSQSRGWSCDSIISYEIVLPNGSIAQVDKDNNSDLFWALPGAGSSNFGIITSFVMEIVELPNPKGVWLELSLYAQDKLSKLLDHTQAVWATDDRDLLVVNFYNFNGAQNSFVFIAGRTHTIHKDPTTLPKSISSAQEIESIPGASQTEISSIAKATATISQGMRIGQRGLWLTLTYRPSREFDAFLYATFEEEVVKLKDVTGFGAKITTQLLPRTLRSNRSGSFLASATDDDDKPLVLLVIAWSYKMVSDAQIVQDTAIKCFERVEAKAREMKIWHPFRYLNYADENFQLQQVWSGYGEENVAKLKKIQKRVDPTGVFTQGGLASGYFKLNSLNKSSL